MGMFHTISLAFNQSLDIDEPTSNFPFIAVYHWMVVTQLVYSLGFLHRNAFAGVKKCSQLSETSGGCIRELLGSFPPTCLCLLDLLLRDS